MSLSTFLGAPALTGTAIPSRGHVWLSASAAMQQSASEITAGLRDTALVSCVHSVLERGRQGGGGRKSGKPLQGWGPGFWSSLLSQRGPLYRVDTSGNTTEGRQCK